MELEKKYRNLLFYTRSRILSELAFYDKDEVSYRDFGSIKSIPRGSLSPNLIWLIQKGLIESNNAHKNPIFHITEEGKIAFKIIGEYVKPTFSPTTPEPEKHNKVD